MRKEKVVIKSEVGLDARPASMFLRTAIRFDSSVYIIKGNARYNGKSILGILSMSAKNGDILELEVTGEDEDACIESLVEFFNSDLKDVYTI